MPDFAALPESAVAALVAGSTYRDFGKGEHVLVEGHSPTHAALIVDGQCMLLVEQPARTLMRLYGPGGTVNLAHAISGTPNFATLAATRRAGVVLIAAATLASVARAHVELCLVAMRDAALVLGRLGDDWASTRIDDVATRVVERLRADATFGELAQRDLADALGLRRETISRVVSDLLDRGVVERRGARLVVIDKPVVAAEEPES